jgi:hypothetical protein
MWYFKFYTELILRDSCQGLENFFRDSAWSPEKIYKVMLCLLELPELAMGEK